MLNATKRERIVRLGAWFVLMAALLPNISYMGHWSQAPGQVEDHHAAQHQTSSDADAHVAHCHTGPAHCGGGESMVGTPFVGDGEEGIALPGSETRLDIGRPYVRLAGHTAVDLHPPQAV